MNDGIMNTWEVRDNDGRVVWTCAKQETAEYLRDWENAAQERIARMYASFEAGTSVQDVLRILPHFSIQEGEVIL